MSPDDAPELAGPRDLDQILDELVRAGYIVTEFDDVGERTRFRPSRKPEFLRARGLLRSAG